MYPSSSFVRRRWAAALLVVTMSGAACQAWHLESVGPESLLLARNPREIRVTQADGSRIVVLDPVLHADTLSGLVADNREGEQRIDIPIADVRRIEALGFSPGKTVGLFAGLAAAVVAIIAITFAIGCSGGACD